MKSEFLTTLFHQFFLRLDTLNPSDKQVVVIGSKMVNVSHSGACGGVCNIDGAFCMLCGEERNGEINK